MANQRVLDALNEQLNMESYFLDNDLDGFANFFNVQVKEERDHSYKFLNYISRNRRKNYITAYSSTSS